MSKQIALTCRWACPPGCVTFDSSYVLSWAWQDVKVWECKLMRQTTSVGISWQQSREEDDEDME